MDEEIQKNYDFEYKIITLGDSGVGKTSIINRFVFDTFRNDEYLTLGIKYSFKILKVGNDNNLKLNVIDTNGQEKYRSLSISYFRNVDVVLFVFDLSQNISFENIQDWINYFNDNNSGKYTKKKFLIGNKNDLEQKVDEDLIHEFAKKNNLQYWAVSAKTSNQINILFQFIAEELYDEAIPISNTCVKTQKSRVLSETNSLKEKKEKKCC